MIVIFEMPVILAAFGFLIVIAATDENASALAIAIVILYYIYEALSVFKMRKKHCDLQNDSEYCNLNGKK